MKIIVAITGASGSIYAKQLVDRLTDSEQVAEVAIIMSKYGAEVMSYEHQEIVIKNTKTLLLSNDDMFASVASGSSDYDAMVLVPCSMGSLARISQGVSSDLISRAGDVMLKERKKILFVVRETPLSLIHLRNMVAVTEAGGIIVPASPSMYSHPGNIEELCNTVTERILQLLKIDTKRYKWGDSQ